MLTLFFLSCVAIVLALEFDPVRTVDVTILNKEKEISADKKYDVECKATGSRPDATITWWKGGHQENKIAETDYKQSYRDNVSLSILSFVPDVDDDGKDLICRVENVNKSDTTREDKWTLNVHYVPLVLLRTRTKKGLSRKPDDIKEGDDVQFECSVLANPKPHRLFWFYDDKVIRHNEELVLILANYSLVVNRVTRTITGHFTCHAGNSVGLGASNPVALNIKFPPTCKRQQQLYVVSINDTVNLKCELYANPPLDSIRWLLVNAEGVSSVPPSKYTTRGSMSYLNYTPLCDEDYGTLKCYGSNRLDHSREPCKYHVIAPGPPHPLRNCTIKNYTADSLLIKCLENFDGGLPQIFVMEALELPNLVPTSNLTVDCVPPVFDICEIEPGSKYQINLFAVNAKGRSDPVTFTVERINGVVKYNNITRLQVEEIVAIVPR